MTPLEKAAKAIATAEGHYPWDAFRTDYHEACFEKARAVLMAVREPEDAIRAIGRKAHDASEWGGNRREGDCFTAMIDAILNEEPKT